MNPNVKPRGGEWEGRSVQVRLETKVSTKVCDACEDILMNVMATKKIKSVKMLQ